MSSNLNNQISKISNKIRKSRNNQNRLRNKTKKLMGTKRANQLSPITYSKAIQNMKKKKMLNTTIQNLEGQLRNMKIMRNALNKTTKMKASLNRRRSTTVKPSVSIRTPSAMRSLKVNNSPSSRSMSMRLSKGLSKMFKKSPKNTLA